MFEKFGDYSLKQFVKDFYEPERIKDIMRMTLQGLAEMHANGIFHRDIKPDNIIVSKDTGKLRIIDWGLAEFYHKDQLYNLRVSTRPFKCPEILVNYRKYDYSFDIWGAGLVLACLVGL